MQMVITGISVPAGTGDADLTTARWIVSLGRSAVSASGDPERSASTGERPEGPKLRLATAQ